MPAGPTGTLSRFDVPLEFDFTVVLKTVERAIPKSFGSMDSLRQIGDNDRKHYAFEASRGDFTAYARGSEVYLRTVFSYEARGYYKPPIGPTLKAGCGAGDKRPTIVVELVAPLKLTSDWHLSSAARLIQVSPASDSLSDRCRVGIIQFDVTDRVMDAARQAITAQLPDIDKKVATIDLTDKATGWWNTLNKPIRLTNDVWLMLHPTLLRLGKVSGQKHVLMIDAGLDAYPAIVMGPEPRATALPLPPLGNDTISSGFRVTVEGRMNYVSASRVFNKELQGKTVSASGHSVTLQSVAVSYDSAGRVMIAVDFTGDAKGTLRLVGKPGFDVAREYIVVPDLNYDLSTDSDLINAYTWLKSDDILLLIRSKARLPIAPELERGKNLVMKGINRTINGVVTLGGTVDSVSVIGLEVNQRGLIVRAGVTGGARMAVRPKR